MFSPHLTLFNPHPHPPPPHPSNIPILHHPLPNTIPNPPPSPTLRPPQPYAIPNPPPSPTLHHQDTDVAIDLTLVEGVPTWGDGTTHEETHPFVHFDAIGFEYPFYTLSDGAFHDRLGDNVARVLCQAVVENGWF